MKNLLVLGFIFHSIVAFSQQDIYDSIFVDGFWRTFNVHLPPSYSKFNTYPLVLGFHGGQQAATSAQGWSVFAYQSELSEKADNSDFIVVYPEGLVFNQNRTWNAGTCCMPAMNQGYDDVSFVDVLLDTLFLDYSIDASRVYATGSSNGGMLCYRLACELSNRIAAIAPNACSNMFAPCNPENKVPVINFHSKVDPIVNYTGGFGGNPILASIFFPSQDSVLNLWVGLNNCFSRDTIINGNGDNYDFIKLTDCACGIEMHHYATSDGSHSWPGGNPNNNPVSTQINATDLLWDFFQNYTLGCFPAGLSEMPKLEFEIYPNPAQTELHIEGVPINFSGEFLLMNQQGKIVLKSGIVSKLSVSSLSVGLYYLLIFDDHVYYSQKFMKE